MRPRLADALLGKVVAGRYRILQLIGSGGTAHIYLAEIAGRDGGAPGERRARVAVKALRTELRGRPDLVSRFEREAVAAARVRHPNVLEVVSPPTELDGVLCFAMELLVGLDLADTLAFARTLGIARAVRIVVGVAEGLAAAHAAGVVHRDVKPENIFLVHAPDGREAVKLLDFGFSFLPGDGTRGSVVGTPEYMAPEQAQGASAHPTADMYSLGIVLYELLAGRVPFSGDYPAVAQRHAFERPASLRAQNPALVVSSALEDAVMTALAKAPEERYASMEAFAAALDAAAPPPSLLRPRDDRE